MRMIWYHKLFQSDGIECNKYDPCLPTHLRCWLVQVVAWNIGCWCSMVPNLVGNLPLSNLLTIDEKRMMPFTFIFRDAFTMLLRALSVLRMMVGNSKDESHYAITKLETVRACCFVWPCLFRCFGVRAMPCAGKNAFFSPTLELAGESSPAQHRRYRRSGKSHTQFAFSAYHGIKGHKVKHIKIININLWLPLQSLHSGHPEKRTVVHKKTSYTKKCKIDCLARLQYNYSYILIIERNHLAPLSKRINYNHINKWLENYYCCQVTITITWMIRLRIIYVIITWTMATCRNSKEWTQKIDPITFSVVTL